VNASTAIQHDFMIEVRNIKKSFGDKIVINDVSSIMKAGQCNLIIGSSGSGKTVLQKCMVGLFEPDEGEVLYDGKNFLGMTQEEKTDIRKEIGMLFQGSALFVALARAIVLNPKYLFCDEPNSGLDPQTSLVIDKLIQELTIEYKITTVINTHDMNSVMEIGNYILYMYQGDKEWEGSNKEIIFSKNQRLNEFIFASEFLKDAKEMRMLEESGKIPNDRNMDELMK